MPNERLVMVEDMVAALLGREAGESGVKREQIESAVDQCSQIVGGLSQCDKEQVRKRLEARFDIAMDLGLLFSSEEDYRPWINDARGEIDWFYWDRYRRLLDQKRFPPQVIARLDDVADMILDHLQDPTLKGKWTRKGLVVGHVQSGKTANYTGLVAKAGDAGYKVIIVLAGILNLLRNQTQVRIDEGFVGKDTSLMLLGYQLSQVLTGVGKIDKSRFPVSVTSSDKDFSVNTLKQLNVSLDAIHEPIVIVIKKNVSTLKNVISWLQVNNEHLHNHPVLLIDDEADHASINTSANPDQATAINSHIRQLLKLFDKCSYVGYTATPFANVFIDPDTDDEMMGDDLFPRDFILNLSPPTNYIGPDRVFSESADLEVVRVIDDYAEELPLRHKKEHRPDRLPCTLQRAIHVFVLVRALRLLRGQLREHNSMMINVTRFTDVQSNVRQLVAEYLQGLRRAIANNHALPFEEAMGSSILNQMYSVWHEEFSQLAASWADVQRNLKDAVSPISVIEVNSSKNAEPLDYSERNYPNGRNVIAIGGLSLSRGLTLEGLTVSYFLRNSIMYDTLMQMGRWFGYRDGYEDLCRLYMSAEAASWYRHIAEAIEELREEFARMKRAGMTPREFGLAVRNHPESLIVTARNKMRTGTKVLRQVSLEGRLIETAVLVGTEEVIRKNLQAAHRLIERATQETIGQHVSMGYFWPEITVAAVKNFLSEFENHPESQLTERTPVECYLDLLSEEGVVSVDIALLSPSRSTKDTNLSLDVLGFNVNAQRRSAIVGTGNKIDINRRRVASRGQEKVGLSNEQILEAERDYTDGGSMPDYVYRTVRERPLLMLHYLDVRDSESGDRQISPTGVFAWGMSFPGVAGSRIPKKLVEYTVNTTWWRQNYLDLVNDDEAELDE